MIAVVSLLVVVTWSAVGRGGKTRVRLVDSPATTPPPTASTTTTATLPTVNAVTTSSAVHAVSPIAASTTATTIAGTTTTSSAPAPATTIDPALRQGEWQLQDGAVLGPDTTAVPLKVTIWACQNGHADDRVDPPVIDYESTQVIVTFWTTTPRGFGSCLNDLWFNRTITLTEPLGQRTLVNGAGINPTAAPFPPSGTVDGVVHATGGQAGTVAAYSSYTATPGPRPTLEVAAGAVPTAPDGTFHLTIPAGSYHLMSWAPCRTDSVVASMSAMVIVPAGGHVEADVSCDAPSGP